MKHHRILTAVCALMIGTGFAAPVWAQEAQASAVALKGEVKVVRQATENGKIVERLEEPGQVLPGDRLVFTTRYTNGSVKPVDDLVVTNPLPPPVKLAKVDGFEVSVDGGNSFGALATLKAAGSDGKPRAAELADVTHVRWRLASIAPGASGEVKYFAEVR